MIKQTLFTALIAFSVSALAETSTPTNVPSPGSGGVSVQEMLVIGHPMIKMHALSMISQGNIKGSVDESYLPGLKACSEENMPPLRSFAARLLGQHFIQGQEPPDKAALEILMTLSRDESSDVRFSAVFYGLTQVKHKSPELIDQLIDISAKEPNLALQDRITTSLTNDQSQVTRFLNEKLKGDHALIYYEIYEAFTGKQPPNADQFLDMPSSRPHLIIVTSSDQSAEAAEAALTEELKKAGVKNPSIEITGKGDHYVLMLTTYLVRDYQTAKEILSNHSTFSITQDIWLSPELETQIESMREAR